MPMLASPTHIALAALAALTLLAPAAPAQQKAATAAEASSAPRGRASWTTDRRPYAVGDIVTILLSESTLASAAKQQSGSDEQERDLGMTAGGGVGETQLPAVDLSVGPSKRSSSRQRGDARRDVRFVAELSVQVVSVSPAGLLELKGVREVDVDKSKQQFTLVGWARPEDISPRNTLESARLANAKVTYRMSGNLGKTRGGLVGRLLTVFWP